jgi:hypothetical protein
MYTFGRFRGLWRVWNDQGVPQSDHLTYESARKEMYRLNGWNYKPSNKKV